MSYNTYCFVCSMPPYLSRSFDLNIIDFNNWTNEEVKLKENEIKKNCQYFNKITIIPYDHGFIHNSRSEGVYADFYSEYGKFNLNNEYFTENISYTQFEPIGTWLHTDCWEFIKDKYKIELTVHYLPLINPSDLNRSTKKYINNHRLLNYIDYGDVIKYCGQYFDYNKIINDKNDWMCYGFQNKKNIDRITKILSQFNFKKENRIGPLVSPTFYKEEKIKFGNNNKFWIVNHGKWIQINSNIIKYNYSINFKFTEINDLKLFKKNKLIKIINNIPLLGLYNDEPLFLSDNYGYYNKEYRLYVYNFSIWSIENFEHKYIKFLISYKII